MTVAWKYILETIDKHTSQDWETNTCMYMHVCIGEDGSQMGNGCESHLFSNIQEWLSQNSLALYNYKVTGDNDCSHKIKRCLLLGRKAMTNLDSLLKDRDIILPTKVCIVKNIVFPVVTYGCESWTIKKAERRKTGAFELWCRRRLLRVPWTARRSKQSILKEINSEYSLEGLMLKLKLQSFGHVMWRASSLEKTWCWERVRAGGEGDNRGWDGWVESATQWTWVWANSGIQWRSLAWCSPWGRRGGHDLETER